LNSSYRNPYRFINSLVCIICKVLRDTCSWINISKTESMCSVFTRYTHCVPPTTRTSTIFIIYRIGSTITSHLKMVT
ncbi:hypothetical protein GIB67_029397, partial [Kingdonia uniflora]